MILAVVQLQSIYHLGEVPVKVNQFQLFVFLALEVLFILVKLKSEIEGLTIFDYNYLYFAYADIQPFLKRYYFHKAYGFILFQIKIKFKKI